MGALGGWPQQLRPHHTHRPRGLGGCCHAPQTLPPPTWCPVPSAPRAPPRRTRESRRGRSARGCGAAASGRLRRGRRKAGSARRRGAGGWRGPRRSRYLALPRGPSRLRLELTARPPPSWASLWRREQRAPAPGGIGRASGTRGCQSSGEPGAASAETFARNTTVMGSFIEYLLWVPGQTRSLIFTEVLWVGPIIITILQNRKVRHGKVK